MGSSVSSSTTIVAVCTTPAKPTAMDLKTALNRCHRYKSFVYGKSVFDDDGVHVEIRARKGSKGICSGCGIKGPTYDTARSPRPFEFVPLLRRHNFRRIHQGYRVAGRTPAKALYDLISEQWLLPPSSDAAQEVPQAS